MVLDQRKRNDEPREGGPVVACVVPTFNNAALTVKLLNSLLASTYRNLIIVAVDNDSSDDSVAIIRERFPTVHLSTNACNLGFAAGTNLGARTAWALGADHVFLVNNDAVVEPTCIERIVLAAQRHPEAGVFGCRIDAVDPSIGPWRSPRDTHQIVSLHKNIQAFDESCEVDQVWGCGMLVTRACFEAVGGFDESFFAYDEDRDFCIRATSLDFRIRYVDDAVVGHWPAQATGGLGGDSPLRAYLLGRNRVRLWRKHADGKARLCLRIAGLAAKTIVTSPLRPNRRATAAALIGIREGLWCPLGEWPRFPPQVMPTDVVGS